MPNFSGLWTVTQQMQASGANIWPAVPGAPTIGTATAGNSGCASIPFTAPTYTGYPANAITSYTATSSPGCVTSSGASSPLVVTGLSTGTSYTFSVKARNATGLGLASSVSNSITAAVQGQDAYTTAGSYSWVAPASVTSVSVVAVGGGGAGGGNCTAGGNNYGGAGGGGGGLGYKNNITVTPGDSYAVVVGAGGTSPAGQGQIGTSGGSSSFNSTTVVATGGTGGCRGFAGAPAGGSYSGTGVTGFVGGNGGSSTNPGATGNAAGGGGAAGYAGAGGCGARVSGTCRTNGTGGSGAGGVNGSTQGGGGGVGILGQGPSGAAASAGGSSGAAGTVAVNGQAPRPSGGAYGGGGAGKYSSSCNPSGGLGGVGAVRIIWPGTTRTFPSTSTGDV